VDLSNDRLQIQSQRLSPLMLHSLNVLQLPTEELHQLVAEEIQRNPLLDITTNDASPYGFSFNGDGAAYQRNTSTGHRLDHNEDHQSFLENISAEYTPQDYLLAQVPDLDEITKNALIILIHHLDERGFLPENVAQAFISINGETDFNGSMNIPQYAFEKAYVTLRSLLPRGIGARDLQDCLLLQIQSDTPLYDLVTHCFNDLEHRRFTQLQRKLRKTSAQLRRLLEPLKHLNFAPLKIITNHTNPLITPEVTFKKMEGQWMFEIRGAPEIKMSNLYAKLLARPLKGNDHKFFTENKRHAQFLIKALQQRQETLGKIAQYILHFQKDFLDHGYASLHPQNQKQVAEFLHIHPSTLSRAIKNKYAQIPRGTIPLSFFFSHGNHGSLIAQNALRENIKRIIADEDSATPLSDEKIAQILQNQGIWIKRRTVMKYRTSLGIASAHVRRYMPL
jgi:RNA polymerase sigma-54 factor